MLFVEKKNIFIHLSRSKHLFFPLNFFLTFSLLAFHKELFRKLFKSFPNNCFRYESMPVLWNIQSDDYKLASSDSKTLLYEEIRDQICEKIPEGRQKRKYNF